MALADPIAPVQLKSFWQRIKTLKVSLFSAATGVCIAIALVSLVWLVVVDDPLGGEPVAVLQLQAWNQHMRPEAGDGELGFKSGLKPEDNLNVASAEEPKPLDDGTEGQSIQSGERVEDPLDIQMDALAHKEQQSKHALRHAPLKSLIERGPDGPLPRIAKNGLTPLQAYARPVNGSQVRRDIAKIAILVGGLGLSALGTQEAINRLPEDVSFAFAPYGSSLKSWVAKARNSGHEVLLQLPLEPFDYPDNDPGPHTLLGDLSPKANARRMQWLLSRFAGYVGVVNYMGAKFTANTDAMHPVLELLNRRGLMYVDDSRSARSQAVGVGKQVGIPVVMADVVLDSQPGMEAIAAALARLETIALEKGVALAVGSALPITIKSIADWAKTLEHQGIVLVPVSATVSGKIS